MPFEPVVVSLNVAQHLQTRVDLQETLKQNLELSSHCYYPQNEESLLRQLATLYGSDKGYLKNKPTPYPWPPHTYTDFYSQLFDHCRHLFKRVFECGIGTNNPNLVSSMGAGGKPGASLRMWRDYFPNAIIHGADVDRQILFTEERIKTHYVDQTDSAEISRMWREIGYGDFDLIIDDGLHTFEAGLNLFESSFEHLGQHGIYIIEDISDVSMLRFCDYFSKRNLDVQYVIAKHPNDERHPSQLLTIRRKSGISVN